MVFSGASFLFFFFPAALAIYSITPRPARNAVLAALSLLFYIWGSGTLVFVLLVSVAADFALGFPAARAARDDNDRLRHQVIAGSVVVNLAMLGFFKYATWILDSLSTLGVWTGQAPDITLPIGISFFTFQSMSYTIDVARGRSRHLSNPLDFMLYVTMFPQLIAGPIVRYHEIEAEIRDRRFTLDGVGEGSLRFAHGLVKKVVIADTIAPIAVAAFAAEPGELSTAAAWLGAVAFTLQIYFDFSGYSDMAIGLGRMFGFTIPENFRRPYSSLSITDFWRRWHITLSGWFRDYLYIPLGGSRMSTEAGVRRNLLIVFFLTGLWHGANLTFVVWGLLHGAFLLIERRRGTRYLEASSPIVDLWRRSRIVLVLVVTWVIFRADDLGSAAGYLGSMFSFDGGGLGVLDPVMTTRAALVMAAASLVVVMPRDLVIGPLLTRSRHTIAGVTRVAVMGLGLPIALLLVASGSFSPFLYFQF